MLRLAKRTWVLLVILLVVVMAAFCVDRFRGFFGHTELTKPGAGLAMTPSRSTPKWSYKIFGPDQRRHQLPGPRRPAAEGRERAAAVDADAHHDRAGGEPEMVAQSDGDNISCRITVDDVVKDERTSDGVNAQTFCIVKSA